MADNKNQHYVPRFYLKHFCNAGEDKHFGIYIFDRDKYLKSVPIDSQTSEDYFYGKDLIVEKALGELEGKCESILSQIIETLELPAKGSDNYYLLLEYVMYQQNRTKLSANRSQNTLNQLSQLRLKDRFVPTAEIAEIKFEYEYPVLSSLAVVPELIAAVYDLKCKLLINKTKYSFITSDHPVVKWNEFLNQRKYPEPRTGLAMRGLKLFFPIYPNITLVYYDSEIYDIGNDNQQIVEISNSKDIFTLNLIQLFNCNEVIFFNQEITESYTKRLSEEQKRVETQIIENIENYCKINNCTVNRNEIQFENLLLNEISSLCFVTEKTEVKDMKLSKSNDYIRPSFQIVTEDTKSTEKIFIEAMRNRFS